jgi:hypothetical protein
MKHIYKPFTFNLLLFSLLFINISGSSSSWSGMSLTPDEMENSIKFQLSRGSNCKGECEKVIPILERFIDNSYPSKNLIHILGEPNEKIETASVISLIYNLSATSNKTELKLDTQDGKLISFKIIDDK